MGINLSDLSFDQLAQLRLDVEKEIRARKSQEASALANLVQERAQQLDVSVDELLALLGKKNTGKKAPLAAKFANPANPSDTWSGKGRKPGWFLAAIAAGKSEADLLIK
ncbi:H-NS histone family protein [Leeia oryzae]|uniref:H-NS histone family protein n=1 Tax=Leeia oryzae TaxID=356662 RepID=UPI00037F8E2D|nr:H-NS histone family protein [Leeia oryzae]